MSNIVISPSLTIAASSVFIPACSIVVALRFYTRRVLKAPLGVDDWLMLPALALVIGMQVTMIVEFRRRVIGYADPDFKFGVPDARSNLAFYPVELIEIPALGTIKLSLIFFFRRIFNTGAMTWFKIFSTAIIAVIALWTCGFFFTWIFICGTHPSDYWLSADIERAKCVNTLELHNALAISDFSIDIIVITMSLPVLWRLQMSTARKFAVTGIFSFGLISVAASLTRMITFLQSTAVRYNPNTDFEHLVTGGIFWGMLEVGLGLIAANLIVIYGLLKELKLHKFGRKCPAWSSAIPTRISSLSSTRSTVHLQDMMPMDSKAIID